MDFRSSHARISSIIGFILQVILFYRKEYTMYQKKANAVVVIVATIVAAIPVGAFLFVYFNF